MTRADLIAKLEAAEGPSRELDGEIWRVIIGIENAGWTQMTGIWERLTEISGMRVIQGPPDFTFSLDAAITLVPAGHWWTAGDCLREKHARVAPETIDDDGHEAFGATVALAICIAALRAREEGNVP